MQPQRSTNIIKNSRWLLWSEHTSADCLMSSEVWKAFDCVQKIRQLIKLNETLLSERGQDIAGYYCQFQCELANRQIKIKMTEASELWPSDDVSYQYGWRRGRRRGLWRQFRQSCRPDTSTGLTNLSLFSLPYSTSTNPSGWGGGGLQDIKFWINDKCILTNLL